MTETQHVIAQTKKWIADCSAYNYWRMKVVIFCYCNINKKY